MNRKIYQWAMVLTCSTLAACSANSKKNDSVTYLSDAEKVQAVVYVNKQTDKNQWMADTETLLRESIKGSPFTLQRQDNGWLVTAPGAPVI